MQGILGAVDDEGLLSRVGSMFLCTARWSWAATSRRLHAWLLDFSTVALVMALLLPLTIAVKFSSGVDHFVVVTARNGRVMRLCRFLPPDHESVLVE
jgi:hypothetical protein